MKTIKETIEKWNEMYNLVMAGAPDICNDSWKRLHDVFQISTEVKDEAMEVIKTYVESWAGLTEDDINADKDYAVWMKCIGDLLVLSSDFDYAFYIHKGVVGVLYDGKFVPGDEMAEKLAGLGDDTPGMTEDDIYGSYSGCTDIGKHDIVNMENEQHLIYDVWVSDVYAESDEYNRELCNCTLQNHTSERGIMVSKLIEAIEADEELDGLREKWKSVVSRYNDPCGHDYNNKADFLSLVNEAMYATDVHTYGNYVRAEYGEHAKKTENNE